MATRGDKYKYDGIVFHSQEEADKAEEFCKKLREISLENGQRFNIVTEEDYSLPGQQEVEIVSSVVRDAKFIFISDHYYHTHPFGQFSGNVANYNKLPSNFIVLKVGFNGKPYPHIASLRCLPLKDWCVSKEILKKIRRIYQDESSLPELHKENEQHETLGVMNPSISSTTSLQYEISQEETDLRRPFTTTMNSDTANTDVSSLTDEDLVTDASFQPEEEEPRSTQCPAPTSVGSQVARVAPQPRTVASSSAGGLNHDNPIAHREGNPRDSADHVQRTPRNMDDFFSDLTDYL